MNKYAIDNEILVRLREGQDSYINEVYLMYRDSFILFICKMFSADPEKAKEIYPESFSKMYFNIKNRKLNPPLKSALKTYLFAVGRRIYLKTYLGTYNKKVSLEESFPELSEASMAIDHYEYEEQVNLVRELLRKLGDKCENLLKMVYLKEMEPEAIRTLLGIEAKGTLRKRKFDCMQKLRKLFREHPIYKSQFGR